MQAGWGSRVAALERWPLHASWHARRPGALPQGQPTALSPHPQTPPTLPPTHLEHQEREGHSHNDAELRGSNAAVVGPACRRFVADPATQQAPHAAAQQVEGNQGGGRAVAHAHELQGAQGRGRQPGGGRGGVRLCLVCQSASCTSIAGTAWHTSRRCASKKQQPSRKKDPQSNRAEQRAWK